MANTDLLDYAGLSYYDSKIKDWTVSDAAVTASGSSAGRTLPNRFADIINVKDYGAIGDGVTDDSDAIQDALDLCEGKAVWFPAGTYLITDTLRVTHGKTMILGTQATLSAGASYDETGIIGLRIVGASDVCVTGMYFEKMFRGIDVWMSEDPSDYPATYANNISDIRIENCTFDTRKWAMSFVGVYGLTVNNVTLNQYRTGNWSNRDGIHLLGCVNVLIDDIMGTTDDDFIAIFPSETFISSSRTYYGICDKIFINNCIVNNTRNYPSETGSRSFLAMDGCDVSLLYPSGTAEEDMTAKFSIDNVFLSNCSVITDSGCVLRIAGNNSNTYMGTLKFSDCFFSRGYISNTIINAQNATTFLVRSGIDEIIFDECKISIDSRWTQSTFVQPLFGLFQNIRRFTLDNCYIHTVKDVIQIDDLNVDAVTGVDYVGVKSCIFEQSNANQDMVVLRSLRRDIEKIEFENVSSETKVSNFIKIQRCNVGTMSFKNINDSTRYAVVEIEGLGINIGTVFISNVQLEKQLLGNDLTATVDGEEVDAQQTIKVVGDFTNTITPNVFMQNTAHIKVHGVDLNSTSWAVNSDPGSVARIKSGDVYRLATMNDRNEWRFFQLEE